MEMILTGDQERFDSPGSPKAKQIEETPMITTGKKLHAAREQYAELIFLNMFALELESSEAVFGAKDFFCLPREDRGTPADGNLCSDILKI